VAEKPKNKKRSPFVDERGDDDWTEKDLAMLERPGFPKESGAKPAPRKEPKTKES
jgi:hypothetical protein